MVGRRQRKVGLLDNRGSHFYLALYWAKALAEQDVDADLRSAFTRFAEQLSKDEDNIVTELNSVQAEAIDIGGYYFPDEDKAVAAMRPSETFNSLLSSLNK